jgi:hypothetical protein
MVRRPSRPYGGGPPLGQDPEADELLEQAFPAAAETTGATAGGHLFAVIPETVIQASPEEFAAFLDTAFADEGEVERVLDQRLAPVARDQPAGRHAVRAVVPAELLRSCAGDADHFVSQVFAAFDEIEDVLAALEERRRTVPGGSHASTTAVVPEEVIADPAELLRAVDRVQSDATRLELLLRQARHTLRRLQVYRLSRRHPGQLLGEIRKADHLRTLQYLVEFLRSIQVAADSFEKLELPRPHIRDYLEHLYSLQDWDQMSELVGTLRGAVLRFLQADR